MCVFGVRSFESDNTRMTTIKVVFKYVYYIMIFIYQGQNKTTTKKKKKKITNDN